MDPLDAYSRVVIAVAKSVTPHVAGVRLPRGTGSAVVLTDEGHLLTNAHVVGGDRGGTAVFADGSESPFTAVGADPPADLAVLRAGRRGRGAGRPARHRRGQPAGPGRFGDRRGW